MMNTDPKIRAQRAPWNNGVEIAVYAPFKQGVLTFEDRAEGTAIDPILRLDMDGAQTLMDDLWNAGIRPTEGAGSAGAMRATERHLEDMRKLVFDQK